VSGWVCMECGVEVRPVHRYPKGQQPERSHPVRAALSGSTAPLDAERLATATHVVRNHAAPDTPGNRFPHPHPLSLSLINEVRLIAAEYARLAAASPDPAPQPAEGEGTPGICVRVRTGVETRPPGSGWGRQVSRVPGYIAAGVLLVGPWVIVAWAVLTYGLRS
jgi:hypothetical protein